MLSLNVLIVLLADIDRSPSPIDCFTDIGQNREAEEILDCNSEYSLYISKSKL